MLITASNTVLVGAKVTIKLSLISITIHNNPCIYIDTRYRRLLKTGAAVVLHCGREIWSQTKPVHRPSRTSCKGGNQGSWANECNSHLWLASKWASSVTTIPPSSRTYSYCTILPSLERGPERTGELVAERENSSAILALSWILWNLSFCYILLHEKRHQTMLWHH